MRDKAANNYPHGIKFVSDCFKTHKMCCKTFYNWYVPDQFKTHEICDEAVDKIPFVLDSIPDQYKTQVMCDEIAFDDPFKFKKCKALKKRRSEELMPIAWYPIRWWCFCMSEDEEKEIKNETDFYWVIL